MKLEVGMTFTGNKHCFMGRIEVLEIDEPNNRLRVSLTQKNDESISNWNEDWDLHCTLVGFELGEYFVNVFPDYPQNLQRISKQQISECGAIAYEPFLIAGLSELPVPGSEAKWVQNANFPNNYTLEKKVLLLGKNMMHDKTRLRIFGWTEEVLYGDQKGMIKAIIPTIPDEDDENGSDCEIIGYFESIAVAMAKIVKRNHPEYGGWWI